LPAVRLSQKISVHALADIRFTVALDDQDLQIIIYEEALAASLF
jgi:hypothetical protein